MLTVRYLQRCQRCQQRHRRPNRACLVCGYATKRKNAARINYRAHSMRTNLVARLSKVAHVVSIRCLSHFKHLYLLFN